MSLRYALLALLLDNGATGYDLAKRFDSSVANFWGALPQQLYQELASMERDGLVDGEVVVQTARPNKRVFKINNAGRRTLVDWFETPVRARPFKDELLVRLYASDLVEPERGIALLQEGIRQHEQKLQAYLGVQRILLRGRSEEQYVRMARRAGPYITLRSGIDWEKSWLEWARWAVAALRDRMEHARGTSAAAS